jgi:hypothetical protein
MTKISDLSAMTGAAVDPANDLITMLDVSEAGVARNKKMTLAELAEAMGAQLTVTFDGAVKMVTP